MNRSKSQRLKPRSAGYIPYSRTSNKSLPIVGVSLALLLGSLALGWGILFLGGVVTLGGVPPSIVGKFLQDPASVVAFFMGDRVKLHQRLQEMGIEEEIKAYYRPQIPDEVQLDQYIHQILYDRTGYVGNNYLATPRGNLVLKSSGERRLRHELQEKTPF
ncbi:MAG: hypothetical protein MUD14_04750 [Hydrococcus sp. Prado102]|jgi:hypothetical protein|nr:hypothetical protein [Hydrococcus sp. Prado102]